MERFCLGVFLAVLLATVLPVLPDLSLMLVLAASAICCALLRAHFFLGFVLFLLSLSLQVHQHQQLVERVLAKNNTEQTGAIVSIPQQFGDSFFFLFELDDVAEDFGVANPKIIAVRWFDTTKQPFAGQRWRFSLRLKAVRGVANPGSGSKDTAALVHGIVAQGTVKTAVQLDNNRTLRQQAYDLIQHSTKDLSSNPILLALTVGERPFTPELWLALQSSGLSHLISISGMHIALVFGWILLLKPSLQYLPMTQLWRERLLWSVALLAALAYCVLAGFAIPTWRAMLAIVVVTLLKMLLRRTSGWRFSLVFTAVLLLCWPTLMLSISFWLSVSAVALIFFMQWRFAKPQNWRDSVRQFVFFQWLFTLMLLPISLLFFHGIAPLGIFCNLLFVPWISIVGIPVLLLVFLLQLLWPSTLTNLWWLVDWLFRPLIWLFEQLAVQDYWWSLPELSYLALIFLMIAVVVGCVGRSRQSMAVALILSLPSVLHWLDVKPNTLHVVDVGQGTAVVLQQADRALVYDVGPRYGDYSATKNHLLPYLRYLGIKHLDYLILSHNDSDHTGHWQLLRQAFPQLRLVTDISDVGTKIACAQLPKQWGDFALQVLWDQQGVDRTELSHEAIKVDKGIPLEQMPKQQPKNHDSCVLLITSTATQKQWRLLLTGDADTAAEQQILNRFPKLQTDVLLLGHHGSKTSSDLAFLTTIDAKIALNSAGYDNPYRHPSAQVQARLELLQTPLYNTADVGAISLEFGDEQLQLKTWREQLWLAWVENVTDNAETPDLTR